MTKLSVVIPAYNEAKRIQKTLLSISEFLQKQSFTYEILVVNDGSKDNTAEVVKNLEPQIPNLKLIDNKINHGKGSVVKQGMLAAQGQYALFTDADNSTSIDQLNIFWPEVEKGYDIVIGSIELPGAVVNEHAQWYRRFVGHLVKYLIRLTVGLWDIKDTQRGFKLFSAKAAAEVFPRSVISRFGFDFEALAIAKSLGFKIKEVPVVWNNSDQSTVNLNSYFVTFGDLVKVRLNLWSGKYSGKKSQDPIAA